MSDRNKPITQFSVSLLAAACSASVLGQAHNEAIEEIIISTPFQQTQAETALPIGILGGEELQEKVSNSLGDTLKNEIGINSASFGPSLGHPVIRGQTGNRVSVLQNGTGVTDASNQSPDHAEGVDALLAERLEVIRGPATLLYGSGAVGGVVNVIDNRIPTTLVPENSFIIDHSHNTANDGGRTVFRLDGAAGQVGLHVNGFKRDSDKDVDIPGLAIDEAALEELEELRHAAAGEGEEEHEEHEEHEEIENTDGFIGNSDADSQGFGAGLSFIGDGGLLGFAVNRLDNNYGLPQGTHSHGHEEHGEHEEEGEEHEGEEHEGEEHEEHGEVEAVRIDLEKTRYEARAQLESLFGPFSNLSATVGYTDYEHSELEFFEDGDMEVGTLFENDGFEGRVTVDRGAGQTWAGVYGLQFSATEFSAIGEEAFIPRSDVGSVGLFGVERFSGERTSVELGFRVEEGSVEPANCGSDDTALSLSGSVLYDLNDESNLLFGVSRSERNPTVEELFSNVSVDSCAPVADPESLVLHAATGLLEIGNPDLEKETANNFELGLRKHAGRFTGELSVFHNEIDDYVYLDITGEEFEEQLFARYLAQDATFTGIEGELGITLAQLDSSDIELRLFGDLVRAELDDGENVPRIPAAKFGAELRWIGPNWSAHLHSTRVEEQDRVAALELPTDGYTLLSAYADYHWSLGDRGDLKLYGRAENLLDEEIRNHTSFLKLFAPEPGRSFMLGLCFEY